MPKKTDPIEEEKSYLAQLWLNEENPEKRQELIDRYLELDCHQMEKDKIRLERIVDPKTIFNGVLTLGLAGMTLFYEQEHSLRSAVKNLWLRRPGR